MKASVQFRTYNRTLKHPFHTAHGLLEQRSGILLRLEREDGKLGFGEIAPLDFFHTESFLEAMGYCDWMPSSHESYFLEKIPESLLCVRYGFESAWRMMERGDEPLPDFSVCSLITNRKKLIDKGIFKVKVGKGLFADECAEIERLLSDLPYGSAIRLDANEGWDDDSAEKWFHFLQPYSDKIQYVEQPCPRGREVFMGCLQDKYGIPVALDESITCEKELKRVIDQGWSGFYVIKPAVWGSLAKLELLLKEVSDRVVFSSSLETAVGLWPLLDLARNTSLSLGVDTSYLFDDDMGWDIHGGTLDRTIFQLDTYKRIWTHIGSC